MQSIYYGPTVLGDKNPTTSGYKAAAKASSLSVQLHDSRKIVAIEMYIHNIFIATDDTVTTSNIASPVKHTTTQGMQLLFFESVTIFIAINFITGNLSGRSADNMPTSGISLPERLKVFKGKLHDGCLLHNCM